DPMVHLSKALQEAFGLKKINLLLFVLPIRSIVDVFIIFLLIKHNFKDTIFPPWQLSPLSSPLLLSWRFDNPKSKLIPLLH
ncbi:hypothetical protein DVA76_19240, partial [Acinetobacter baumannii]